MADPEHLEWLVSKRADIQRLLLRIHQLADRDGAADNDHRTAVLHWSIGISFSLWRAVFLLDRKRDRATTHEEALQFLEALIEDNIVPYGLDKRTGAWSGGYYLQSAFLRLRELGNGLTEAGLSSPARLPEIDRFLSRPFSERQQTIQSASQLRALWELAYEVQESVVNELGAA